MRKDFIMLMLGLIAAVLTACDSQNFYAQGLASWRGSHVTTLMQAWGVPDRVIKLPNGESYYSYTEQTTQSYPSQLTPSFATITNSKGQTSVATLMMPSTPSYFTLACTTWFEINAEQIIVSAKAKGNYCFADKETVKSISKP